MSAGATDGKDLTVETLRFLNENWDEISMTFARARSSSGFRYDTTRYDTRLYGSGGPWMKPVLRNHDNKTIYPSGETSGYSAQLRQNDVITVQNGGRVDSVTGTEFDFDVEWDIDVRCEALPANGFSVIGDTTDWRVFVHVARRSILADRHNPVTDPNCKFDWRWLTIVDEGQLPEAEDNRDVYGVGFTVRWHGFERLPAI